MQPDDHLQLTFRAPLAYVHEAARVRAPGFASALLAVSVPAGDEVLIKKADWHRLTREYQAPSIAVPPEPTVAELATNFVGAMGRWAAAGFPTVSSEAYAARAAVCDACVHWDGAARFGLGKCAAPGCGCTSTKRWLTTEKCPLGKWPALP